MFDSPKCLVLGALGEHSSKNAMNRFPGKLSAVAGMNQVFLTETIPMEHLTEFFTLVRFKIDPRVHCYQSLISLIPEIKQCSGFERLRDDIKRLSQSLASCAHFLHCACCEDTNETIVPGNFPDMLWGTKFICKEHKKVIEDQIVRRINSKSRKDVQRCFPESSKVEAFGTPNVITELIGDFIFVNGSEKRYDGEVLYTCHSPGSVSATLQSPAVQSHRSEKSYACMHHCLETAKTELDQFIVAMSTALGKRKSSASGKRTYTTMLVPSGSDTDA